jgi:SAM-dependent methyltransferase
MSELDACIAQVDKFFRSDQYFNALIASKEMLALARRHPDEKNAVVAIRNAAICREKFGMSSSAMALYEEVGRLSSLEGLAEWAGHAISKAGFHAYLCLGMGETGARLLDTAKTMYHNLGKEAEATKCGDLALNARRLCEFSVEARHSFMWEQRATKLIDLLSLTPGATIIDAGCGYGKLLGRLLEDERQFRCIGVDIVDDSFVDILKATSHPEVAPRLKLLQADAQFSLGDQTADAVVSQGVIHFMKNPQAHFSAALRSLQSGGRFAASLWLYPQLQRPRHVLRSAGVQTAQMGGWTAEQLASMMNDCGFSEVVCWTDRVLLEFTDHQIALDYFFGAFPGCSQFRDLLPPGCLGDPAILDEPYIFVTGRAP